MENLSLEHISNAFPGISVNTYISSPKKDMILSRLHIHSEIELMYVTKGKIRWHFSHFEIIVAEGECIFVNSRVPHSTYATEDSSYFLLQFSRDKLLSSYSSAEKYLYYFILTDEKEYCLFDYSLPYHKDIITIMKNTLKEHENDYSYKEIFVHSYSMQIIATLMRAEILSTQYTNESKTKPMQKILPVIEYINENYHKPITLNQLSAHLGFNSAYLCRLFKSATNKTMSEYLNFLRIEKSLKLLSTTKTSITEIALSVGFSNISHFNSTFQKQISCSPSAYRKTRLIF